MPPKSEDGVELGQAGIAIRTSKEKVIDQDDISVTYQSVKTGEKGSSSHSESQPSHENRFRLYSLAVMISVNAGVGAVCVLGMNVMSGTLANLYDWDEDEEDTYIGLINALSLVGGISGTLSANFWINRFGRLKVLFISNFMFMTTGGVIAVIYTLPTLLIGRFIMLYGSSLLVFVSPPFLREISPTRLRGFIGSFHQQQFATSTIIAFALGLGLPDPDDGNTDDNYWRFVVAFPAIFAVAVGLILLLFFRDCESPKFLFLNGKADQARRILERLQTAEEAKESYNSLQVTRQAGNLLTCKDLKRPEYLKSMVFAMYMMVVLHATGAGSIFMYSTDIFAGSGGDKSLHESILTSIIYVGITFLISVLFGSAFIAKVKRRHLTIGSLVTTALATLSVALSDLEDNSTALNISVMTIIASFGMGYGVVVFPYIAEIVEAELLIYCRMVHWTMLILTSIATKPAISALGLSGFYFFYTGANVIFLLIAFIAMVETSGLTAEQIRAVFGKGTSRERELRNNC